MGPGPVRFLASILIGGPFSVPPVYSIPVPVQLSQTFLFGVGVGWVFIVEPGELCQRGFRVSDVLVRSTARGRMVQEGF